MGFGVLLTSSKYSSADKRKFRMMSLFKRLCYIYSFSVQQTFEKPYSEECSQKGLQKYTGMISKKMLMKLIQVT